MQHSASIQAYMEELTQLGTWPKGFQGYSTSLTFVPSERPVMEPYRMNMAWLRPEKPVTAFAGVFTRNTFPGAPVLVGKKIVKMAATSGVLVNNRISNVCSPTGCSDIEALQRGLSGLAGFEPEGLFCVSTGIIGWRLPLSEMQQALPALVQTPVEPLDVARAIMTTDNYPKIRVWKHGKGSIMGIAKGAGMIEPNMATMLVFLLTDFDVSREFCRQALSQTVEQTFNCISVDSDQSTSDMALLLSSGQAGPITEELFSAGLLQVCSQLAGDIVRNGEGVSHVINVEVCKAPSAQIARDCGKAIVNSPLVKTAVYGNDPNVGRIIGALGDYCGNSGIELDPQKVRVEVEGIEVFRNGAFSLSADVEQKLAARMTEAAMNPRISGYPQNQDSIKIKIELGMGNAQQTVFGADLTHEYVTENADYRT
ncbi:MAG: bifunctional glutamate N-acetyltransferase/amino-acid acetyltransferase ArgJ [Spirochaetaceae bacterium]|nr:MAG: bifunctional glutamate N-acetyltransferase/amino-acid acetyltransferase ArgJ [Spirochaetaceae bacterium]